MWRRQIIKCEHDFSTCILGIKPFSHLNFSHMRTASYIGNLRRYKKELMTAKEITVQILLRGY